MWEQYSHIVPHIEVGAGVIEGVAPWLVRNGYKTPLVVSDPNTRRAAGERLLGLLTQAGCSPAECLFPQDEPLPDEEGIGRLTASAGPDIDIIVGVGSGTINDLCKYVGFRTGKPCIIVGTASSMDGYAAVGAAMLIGGVKVTPPTQCPSAIFCDTDVLRTAPMPMMASGLGDMLGKWNALADWKLSHILTGEPYPAEIVSLMEGALKKITDGAARITSRDPDVIASITEGLILSGIAMSLYGDSRPASGTEHHLAHYWEMRYCAENKPPVPHGAKVGVATVAALKMWKMLTSVKPERFSAPPAKDTMAGKIRAAYGGAAEALLKTENPNIPIDKITAHWDEILEIARSLPEPEEIARMLAWTGGPVRPAQIALDDETLADSVLLARERKKTYTLLQLLGDLGRLEDFASRLRDSYRSGALDGVKCFVLDMDGTIYLGDSLFPYTRDFLDAVKNAGREFVFFTNNSSQNRAHYLKKLAAMGIDVPPEKMLMSTHVLLRHLEAAAPGKRVFVAGTPALKEDFSAAGYALTGGADADFAVLGFDRTLTYETLTVLCDCARAGLPVFGVNTDYNCPVEGGFIPDCGAIAAALTAATGARPEFFGKPSRRALEYICQKTGYAEGELCFVGDRLYTDIAITRGTSARSVLVLSGESGRGDLRGLPYTPDIVVENIGELAALL